MTPLLYEELCRIASQFRDTVNELPIEEAIRRVQAGNVEDYRIVVVAFHQRLRTGIAALCPPEVEADEIAHVWRAAPHP